MITFVICMYNEENVIELTVQTILKAIQKSKLSKYEIIFVDDGSIDSTFKKVKSLFQKNKNFKLITNGKNLGYGASLIKAISFSKYEKLFVIPADNEFSIENIEKSIKYAYLADIVMFYPIDRSNRDKWRVCLSMIYNLIYLIFFDIKVNYIHSPSIYSSKILKKLKFKSKRFSITTEILVKVLYSNVTYAEVPMKFTQNSRVRNTVSLKNFIDVLINFIRLYIQIKCNSKYRLVSKKICTNDLQKNFL